MPRIPLALWVAAGTMAAAACGGGSAKWWKGNLHTHSLWSDGDDYPEMIVEWYHAHGYHFVALSDHNILARGSRWIDPATSGGVEALAAYRARFGDQWVEQRGVGDSLRVRLKTLEEYRTLFEEPDRFLVIESEEITDRFEDTPLHVNATNISRMISPQGGGSVLEILQNNVNAVLAQRRRTGQRMFPHVNHPNFGWAVRAEDLIALRGERFFEVYNGHPAVHNEGDNLRPSTERLWDIVLAERLSRGRPALFGLAVDDAHNYHSEGPTHSNPGRAWVMVRARELTADALISAMETANFYSTTGVMLANVRFARSRLSLSIVPEAGVSYTTQFIGTRRGYPPAAGLERPVDSASVGFLYSADIGVVFAEVAGHAPVYRLTGDELYVRAKVISSKPKSNPYREGEVEVAWTQPFVP